MDAVCRHPVLSRGWVWRHHFITCTDEKRWKTGKRKAESRNTSAETLTGPSLFLAIKAVSLESSSEQAPAISQAILYVFSINFIIIILFHFSLCLFLFLLCFIV